MCVCGWVSHCHLLTVWTAATRFTFTYLPEVYSSTRVVSPRTQGIRFSSFFALSPCVLCFLTLSKAQHARTHTYTRTHTRSATTSTTTLFTTQRCFLQHTLSRLPDESYEEKRKRKRKTRGNTTQ